MWSIDRTLLARVRGTAARFRNLQSPSARPKPLRFEPSLSRATRRESSAHSPPHSSITSCQKGFGSAWHCLSTSGRAHARLRHSPRAVLSAACRPRNLVGRNLVFEAA